MAEDRLTSLDILSLDTILCKLDLPDLKLVNQRLRDHVSSPEFSLVYNQRETACFTWAITHVFTEVDQFIGLLHCYRPLDIKAFFIRLDGLLENFVQMGDRLTLLSAAGSLCLFKVVNQNGDVSLLTVDAFHRNVVVIPPAPNALEFNIRRHIEIVSNIEVNLAFLIHCMQMFLDDIPSFCGFSSLGLGAWGDLLEAVLVEEDEILETDDPRNMILNFGDWTYLVTFPHGELLPLFKEVETPHIVDYGPLDIDVVPILPGWLHRVSEHFSRTGDGFLVILVRHFHLQEPDVYQLRQLLLFCITDDWSEYELVSTFPVEGFPPNLFRLVEERTML